MKLQTKAERRGALATYWQKHSKIENHNVKWYVAYFEYNVSNYMYYPVLTARM